LSEALAAAIAHSELTIIDGAGHLSNLERPVEFNRAVDRFLARVEQKN
jgi:pimeloyl-ACP methyl ester carboxylesterase